MEIDLWSIRDKELHSVKVLFSRGVVYEKNPNYTFLSILMTFWNFNAGKENGEAEFSIQENWSVGVIVFFRTNSTETIKVYAIAITSLGIKFYLAVENLYD